VAGEPAAQVTGREVVLAFGERRWRVRGLDKASSHLPITTAVTVMSGAGSVAGGGMGGGVDGLQGPDGDLGVDLGGGQLGVAEHGRVTGGNHG
jgi:hypothetical protein